MNGNNYSRLFRLTCRFIKYFFLVLIGLFISFVLATGVLDFAMPGQLILSVVIVIGRMAIILLCLIFVMMIAESLP